MRRFRWTRYWYLHLLEAKSADPIHVPIAVLKQYLAKATKDFATQGARRAGRQTGRRPSEGIWHGGSGRPLITTGTREEDAVRQIAKYHGKPNEAVRDALRRHRANQSYPRAHEVAHRFMGD